VGRWSCGEPAAATDTALISAFQRFSFSAFAWTAFSMSAFQLFSFSAFL
jgi:hypothetical protein